MMQMGIKRALPLLIVTAVLTAVALFLYLFEINKEALYISHESGIYSDSFDLNVRSSGNGTIFYTTDGHVPDANYVNVKEYTEPIEITCGKETATYSLKFCCYYKDGSKSDVYSRDFIVDPKGNERFTTTYVVSIQGDEEQLFGEEAGIFSRGKQFYEYLEANPDINVLATVIPANYYSGIEVPVHAAMFDKDGKQIVEQNCGIKLYGNYSRQHNQKSFRLYARYMYDDINEFSYEFFHDLFSDDGGTLIDDYQRLSFRNSGTDHDFGFIRSELVGKLARQAGYPDTLAAESVTVYINGKYQGIYWLQNTYDDRYFKEKYGEYNGQMTVVTGSIGYVPVYEIMTPEEQQTANDYMHFHRWLTSADMSDEASWNRVCDTLDIKNFAQYFAIEYYTGNHDWPQNNVKIYRYVPAGDEMYQEDSVFDGRFRYLLYDTDYSFGLKYVDMYGDDVYVQRLENFMMEEAMFSKLMEREEFREMFVGYVLAMMNITFDAENVSYAIEELNEMRYDEMLYMMEESGILKGSIYEEWGVGLGGMADAKAEWDRIVEYASIRPNVIIGELQAVLDFGETFPLVFIAEQGNYYIGNVAAGNSFEVTWLEGANIALNGELDGGMQIDGYLVNGQYYEGACLNIIPTEIDDWAKGIFIEPVVSEIREEKLEIVEYRLDGPEDYIVLENRGTTEIYLADYSISDDIEEISKGRLPQVILQPGESFMIYGGKYTGNMVSNSIQVPFSWNSEESVYLYHQTRGMVN